MSWMRPLITRTTVVSTTVAAGIAAAALMGAALLANATSAETGTSGAPVARGSFVQNDPGCDMFGWQHPLCAGGAFETPPDDGIPGDNAAEGGIPAPAMVPNIDGSLSPPGTPGAI
ncbi:hypothetical protein ABQF34_12920 [Mycolicibacterium boenickei]